jgi:hypothetical protein
MLQQMTNFNVTVPSNGSMKYFPDNRADHFKNQLAREIILQGDWEVALSEIHYPNTWKNLDEEGLIQLIIYRTDDKGNTKLERTAKPDGSSEIKFDFKLRHGGNKLSIVASALTDKRKAVAQSCDFIYIFIKAGNYDSVEEVLSIFNRAVRNAVFPLAANQAQPFDVVLRADYDKITKLITLFSDYNMLDMIYYRENDAARILGLDPITENEKYKHIAVLMHTYLTKPPILDTGSSFYIYTDIIDSEHVGDTLAPLLRAISTSGNKHQMTNHIFEREYYKRVNRNLIQALEIQIKKPTGESMKFQYGSVICVLHFKKVSF